MTFDLTLSKILRRKDETSTKVSNKYEIKRNFKYKNPSKQLYVILLPWHSNGKIFNILQKKIYKMGHSTLAYQFSSEILTPNYKHTKQYYLAVKKHVKKDIHEMKKKHKYKKITIIGISLSGTNAMMVADSNKDIDEIYLVTIGHSVAESLWESTRTTHMKKVMESLGMTLNKLKKEWKSMSPRLLVENLNHTQITMLLSKKDIIIPYNHGKKLVSIIKEKNIKHKVFENKYRGHYGTILGFCLNPKKYLSK